MIFFFVGVPENIVPDDRVRRPEVECSQLVFRHPSHIVVNREVYSIRTGEKTDKEAVEGIVDAVIDELSVEEESADFDLKSHLLHPFALQGFGKSFSIAVLPSDELPFSGEGASLLSLCNEV